LKWLKKAQQVKSNVKSILIYFFDITDNKFVPPSYTVSVKFCCNVPRQVREDMRQRWPDTWRMNKWVFHHNNARAHTAVAVKEFLASRNMMIAPPPLLACLAPVTSSSHPRWKSSWRGENLTLMGRSAKITDSAVDADA
jgi:hypothetical protein